MRQSTLINDEELASLIPKKFNTNIEGRHYLRKGIAFTLYFENEDNIEEFCKILELKTKCKFADGEQILNKIKGVISYGLSKSKQ